MGLEPASVRAFTLSNISISETSWPIVIKFHLGHHWGGGLAALGFGPDRIRTLVSMLTDSSHRVIMGKSCDHSSSFIFVCFFLNLYSKYATLLKYCILYKFFQVTRTTKTSWMSSKFGKIRPGNYELAALERLEKSP